VTMAACPLISIYPSLSLAAASFAI